MKVVGIIAEYNPFHKGHAYHLKKTRQQTQADYVIIAMSGNFVQRGAPALLDKYSRTQMALCCGADLVLELPVLLHPLVRNILQREVFPCFARRE